MVQQSDVLELEIERAAIPGTSLKVSRVALGTWAIGGWMWGGTDEAESVATIRAAVEHGINVIDTAPAYGFGRSEEIVGKALAEGGLRSRVLIATKVGLEWKDGKYSATPAARGSCARSRIRFAGCAPITSTTARSACPQRFGKRVIELAVRWTLDQGVTTALWGARHPGQLQPVDEVSGWSIDATALAEIDHILKETITDPVGPEFMAPPARSVAA
jgi:aryl-alcohol dehydrogenase-like predicted oxidoreductase